MVQYTFQIISSYLTNHFDVRNNGAFLFWRCQKGCYHLQVIKVLPFVYLGETQGKITFFAIVRTEGRVIFLDLARQLQSEKFEPFVKEPFDSNTRKNSPEKIRGGGEEEVRPVDASLRVLYIRIRSVNDYRHVLVGLCDLEAWCQHLSRSRVFPERVAKSLIFGHLSCTTQRRINIAARQVATVEKEERGALNRRINFVQHVTLAWQLARCTIRFAPISILPRTYAW